jgi:hypothetical protein
MLVYGLVGVFGAARFGRDTAGDILVNTWLGGRAEGVLDLAVTAYLAISVPPVQARQWQGQLGSGSRLRLQLESDHVTVRAPAWAPWRSMGASDGGKQECA